MRLFTRLQAVADEPVGFKRHAVKYTTICIDRSPPCPAILQRFVGKATALTVCHIGPQQVLVEPGTQSDLRVPGFSVSHVALRRRDVISSNTHICNPTNSESQNRPHQALLTAAFSSSTRSFFNSLLRNTVVSSVTVQTESKAQASKMPISRPISFLVLKMIVRTALLTRKNGVATPYW